MTNTRIKDTLYEDAHLDERGMQDRGGRGSKGSVAAIAAHLAYFFISFFLLVLPASQRRMTIAAHIRFRFSQLGPGTDTHAHAHTQKRPHQFGRVHIYPNHTHSHTRTLTHTQRSGAVYLCACFFWRSFIILVAVFSHAPLRHATPTTAHRIRCSLLSQFS